MTELGEVITVRGEQCRVVDRFPIKNADGFVIAYGIEAKPLEQENEERVA